MQPKIIIAKLITFYFCATLTISDFQSFLQLFKYSKDAQLPDICELKRALKKHSYFQNKKKMFFAISQKMNDHNFKCLFRKFPCTQCTRMFRTELFARRHMKDIHKLIACTKPGVEGTLNCIECLETFTEWTELREHFDRLHEPVRNFD